MLSGSEIWYELKGPAIALWIWNLKWIEMTPNPPQWLSESEISHGLKGPPIALWIWNSKLIAGGTEGGTCTWRIIGGDLFCQEEGALDLFAYHVQIDSTIGCHRYELQILLWSYAYMAVRGWAHSVDRDVRTGEVWWSLSYFRPYMYDIVLICPSFSAEKCPLCLGGLTSWHIVSVIRLSVVILFEDCYFRSGMTFVENVVRILGFQVFLVAIQK